MKDVNVANFVRAETDHMLRANMQTFGMKIGALTHLRQPTTPDKQTVIRMNQDTLYSATVLDLSRPVKLTLPEAASTDVTVSTALGPELLLMTSPGLSALGVARLNSVNALPSSPHPIDTRWLSSRPGSM